MVLTERGIEGMVSSATAQVAEWLTSGEMRPNLVRLVQAWNVHGLLGINLADQLREMVTEQAAKLEHPVNLDGVDWSELAERYAEEIVGVDETELTRRRQELGG